MAQEKSNATRRQTNLPNESDKYLSKREELRLAEIELRVAIGVEPESGF